MARSKRVRKPQGVGALEFRLSRRAQKPCGEVGRECGSRKVHVLSTDWSVKSNGLCGAIQKKGAGIARLLRPSFLYSFPRRPLLARSYSQRACRCLRYLLLFLLLPSPCSWPWAGRYREDVMGSTAKSGVSGVCQPESQAAASTVLARATLPNSIRVACSTFALKCQSVFDGG